MKISIFLTFCVALLMSSCSIVKNQKSANFARVKYNSHLKLGKQQAKGQLKKIESLALETPSREEQLKKEASDSYTEDVNKKQVEEEKEEKIQTKESKTLQVEQLLKDVKRLEVREETSSISQLANAARRDEWWNDDLEDWPWLEIVLAAIAILVIAIIITWLAGLIGGIISALIGLILLIALAYLLYVLWIQ